MKKHYVGIHEQIGSFEIKAEREKIEAEPLAPLPDICLPGEGIDPQAAFQCRKTALSPEELEAELEKQQDHYRPFLEDLAPALEQTRTSRKLTRFQWRVGTDADAGDFAAVLAGSEDWVNVEIPHFGEPIGLAVTYYRTEFRLSEEELAKESQWICFGGVDYKAHVYINGTLVGSHTGFFAPFAFDFTAQARLGMNVCVVMVENDFIPLSNSRDYRGTKYTGDKIYAQTGVGYDEPLMGWHHCPAGMGIWQDVTIEGRSHLFIEDIFVRPTAPEEAELWVELWDTRVTLEDVTLDISVYGQNFRETVFEHRLWKPHADFADPALPTVALKMERGLNYLKIPLRIPEARIWDTETPWLYQVQLRLLDSEGQLLDAAGQQFGMRFFTMDTECSPKGMFRLNGRRIRLRGVNSQGREQRMVFLKDYRGLLRDYLLAKVGNINYLRITQRPVQPEVYELCDRLGLLVQTDFPAFGRLRRSTLPEALKQAQEMEHLIRSHPCCVVCTYINEPYPAYMIMPHRCLTREELETFFACADRVIHLQNPDRVIKPIDGDYDPPVSYGLPDYHCYTCWYNGHGIDFGMLHKGFWMPVKAGWNYGCGEYGMEGMDPVPLMKKYYPREWLPAHDGDPWTPADIPGDPPPQVGTLHHVHFETPTTMEEWVEASQTYQAQAMNYMTRAYRRNRKMVSYAYHLYIDAYPDGWLKAMVDFERTPKKAFWEFRAASAPVLADLRCDRFKVTAGEEVKVEVWGCNDPDEKITDAKLHYQVFLEGKTLLSGRVPMVLEASDSCFLGYLPISLPQVEKRSALSVQVAFIRENGEMLSSYALELEVFPACRKDLGKVCLIGADAAFAEKLGQEFEFTPVPEAEADGETSVLIFDPEAYRSREAYWLERMEQGAKVLLFGLPAGVWQLAGSEVFVKHSCRKPIHFVARSRTHPITGDFGTNDVRHWFDEEKGYITPILYDTFEAEDFSGILISANREGGRVPGEPHGAWRKTFAVAEKQVGRGCLRVSLIDLRHRIRTNPVAKRLLERLITYGTDPETGELCSG